MADHNTPCTSLIDAMQKHARMDEQVKGQKELIGGIDAECCKNREDISKLKVQIAVLSTTASFLGGALGGWIGDVTRGVLVQAWYGAKSIIVAIINVINSIC